MEWTKKIMIAAALGLALSGCATRWAYVGPGQFSEAQWHRDVYECERDASMLPKTQQTITTVGGIPSYSDPSHGWRDIAARERMMERCMRSKGYARE